MSRIPRIGDRVRFTAAFLRSTGQYTGPDAPASHGPFARGEIVDNEMWHPGVLFAVVRWDDGTETTVNFHNLETCR